MSIARLMLGTANFGIDDYPPGKGHRRVSRDDAYAIIRHAYSAGIRAFDTALAYGNGLAEDVLADALDERPAHVTTKLPAGYVADRRPAWLYLQHNPLVHQMDPRLDGASVYTAAQVGASIEAGHGHIQVPYWLMDFSLRWVVREERVAVTTYARQPYGRGQVPCQAALWFALDSHADYIVVGARTIAQLDDTLCWAESTPPNPLLPSVCTPGR